MGETVCAECREPIPDEAEVCGSCGHAPGKKHAKWAKIDGVLGGLLIASVVGSPVGVYLVWRSLRHNRAAKRGPGVAA